MLGAHTPSRRLAGAPEERGGRGERGEKRKKERKRKRRQNEGAVRVLSVAGAMKTNRGGSYQARGKRGTSPGEGGGRGSAWPPASARAGRTRMRTRGRRGACWTTSSGQLELGLGHGVGVRWRDAPARAAPAGFALGRSSSRPGRFGTQTSGPKELGARIRTGFWNSSRLPR